MYLTRVKGHQVYCLDRECRPRVFNIDPTEFRFKLALINRRYEDVLHMVRNARLVGQSIIAYLQQKGYPEVALHFVRDEKTRFALALDCGNLEVALQAARSIDEKWAWEKLGEAALWQGNQQIVEMAYQRTKNFEKLTFLYLVTGNFEKLRKMMKIAEIRRDSSAQFVDAIYLGDVEERVKLLKSCGQKTLAFTTAATHGLDEEANEIAEQMDGKLPELKENAKLIVPPRPVAPLQTNWPLLAVQRGGFDAVMSTAKSMAPEDKSTIEATPATSAAMMPLDIDDDGAAWGDDELILEEGGEIGLSEGVGGGEEEGGGWDVDIETADIPLPTPTAESGGVEVVPTTGQTVDRYWASNAQLAHDALKAGAFETAGALLNSQIGAVNFSSVRQIGTQLRATSMAFVPTFPGLTSVNVPLNRNWKEQSPRNWLPAVGVKLAPLLEQLQSAYQFTTQGKFSDALNRFRHLIQCIPFLVVESKPEVSEAAQMIEICREYVVGLSMELERKKLPDSEAKRNCEMAAYFTHLGLQPLHKQLTLRTAMTTAYKGKNFKTAASFARRLLEMGPKPEVAAQTRKVLQICEQQAANGDAMQLLYDELNPFDVCATTYTPIYRGRPIVKCPFCSAAYHPEGNEGKTCNACELCEIGKAVSGLKIATFQR